MYRVVVLDDYPVVREGVKRIIETAADFSVVGEAADVEAALQVLHDSPWDVTVLDPALPSQNGVQLLEKISQEVPEKPLLAFSDNTDTSYAARVLRAGAAAYVTKDAAPDVLVFALRKIVRGGRYTSSELAEKITFDMLNRCDRPPSEILSRREYLIMSMIAWGNTVTEIAKELNLSVKTVSTYRTRVLEKLSLRNNAEVTRYAIRNNVPAPVPIALPTVEAEQPERHILHETDTTAA